MRLRHFAAVLFIALTISAAGCQSPLELPAAADGNAAANYCIDQGYEYLALGVDPDGSEVGSCLFPDGSRCDALAFQQGDCAPGDSIDFETAIATLSPTPNLALTPVITEGVTQTETIPTVTIPTLAPTITSTRPITSAPPLVATPPISPPVSLAGLATISATSTLPSDGYATYSAEFALDGDLTTTWTEGIEGPGLGEYVEIRFAQPVRVTGIGLSIGYDISDTLFFGNNRVAQAQIIFSNGVTVAARFDDVRGIQPVALDDLDAPLLVDSLRIVIDEVYAGSIYDDTCIGEIEILGYPP